MKNILNTEIELGISFPEKYKKILKEFEIILVLENDKVNFDLYTLDKLFEAINNTSYCKTLKYMSDNPHQDIDINKTFLFGSSGNGKRVFFNLKDMSIWEYWLDDDSMIMLYQNFDHFIKNAAEVDKM